MNTPSPLAPKILDLPVSNKNQDLLSADDLCLDQLKRFWLSRSLLFCHGAKELAKERFNRNKTFKLLGFKEDELEDIKPSTRYKVIKSRSQQFIETKIIRQGDLFTNLQHINHHFGMNTVETEVMLFATLIELDPDYGDCYDTLGKLSNRVFYSYLARIINIPEKVIIKTLTKEGLLYQSGLLKVDSSAGNIDSKFDLLSGFCSALDSPQQNIESLFSSFITPAPLATLTPKHFSHIEKDYSRLSAYLQTVCDKKIRGANILIMDRLAREKPNGYAP